MTPEAQQAINNMTSTDIGMVCLTLIILVVVPCMTLIIRDGKIGTLSWEKGKGFKYEKPNNGNEITLQFIDKQHDEAEDKFKRKMLTISYECFKDNRDGWKHATDIIALNHCMRDIASLGFENYISNVKQTGRWSDAETECFAMGMLMSARVMIDERLDTYEKSSHLKSSDTFRKITQGKIEKNLRYSEIVNRNLERLGICSSIIKEGHEWRSSILTKTGEQT